MCMNSAMKTIDNPSELSKSNPIIKKNNKLMRQGKEKQNKEKINRKTAI